MKFQAAILIHLLVVTRTLADTPVVLPDDEKFTKDAQFLVETKIPGDFKTAEGILAALFLLGDQVENKKLTFPFNPKAIESTSPGKGALPLGTYFRGARMEDKKIIVCFSEGGMRYLNNAAGIQQYVKGALEATLKRNFPDVTEIQYEIDGKIVDGWDA